MNFIVIDLEFNQPFDFPEGDKTVADPKCPVEIIQIGAVKLDENFKLVDQTSLYVKPQIYRRMHPFVAKITGLNMDILRNADGFVKVYDEFVEFIGGGKNILCTWGSDDIKELYRNILYYELNNKILTRKYINIQQLTGAHLNHLANCIGLRPAVEALNIPIKEPFHDALNDADYTAKIFQIVQNENMQIQTFNLSQLKNNIAARLNSINVKPLFDFAESKLRRKLSQKDREAIIKIYNAGRLGRFDSGLPNNIENK